MSTGDDDPMSDAEIYATLKHLDTAVDGLRRGWDEIEVAHHLIRPAVQTVVNGAGVEAAPQILTDILNYWIGRINKWGLVEPDNESGRNY
jgi:hypothetical protein